MKRLLLFAACFILFTFLACGGGDESSSEQPPTATNALVPTATDRPASPTDTPVPVPHFTVNSAQVNVRTGPGTVFAIAGTVEQGGRFDVSGRNVAEIDHYIRTMGDDDMIHVRLRSEHEYDQLQCWPVAFREKGVVFLDYAKDEKIWNESMEEMRGRNDTPTLKKMRKALREAAELRIAMSETDLLEKTIGTMLSVGVFGQPSDRLIVTWPHIEVTIRERDYPQHVQCHPYQKTNG